MSRSLATTIWSCDNNSPNCLHGNLHSISHYAVFCNLAFGGHCTLIYFVNRQHFLSIKAMPSPGPLCLCWQLLWKQDFMINWTGNPEILTIKKKSSGKISQASIKKKKNERKKAKLETGVSSFYPWVHFVRWPRFLGLPLLVWRLFVFVLIIGVKKLPPWFIYCSVSCSWWMLSPLDICHNFGLGTHYRDW